MSITTNSSGYFANEFGFDELTVYKGNISINYIETLPVENGLLRSGATKKLHEFSISFLTGIFAQKWGLIYFLVKSFRDGPGRYILSASHMAIHVRVKELACTLNSRSFS